MTEKSKRTPVSGLLIPDNVLKRMLQNVYFIWGSNEGISVANELGRKYGLFVYHTCENRLKHSKNADPQFQPGLCRYEPELDFFAQNPEDAIQLECEIVHDFTPMVIMDLIQLTEKHEKIICENDVAIDRMIQFVTHSVTISDQKALEGIFERYEKEILCREIPDDEKKRLIGIVNDIKENAKFPIWRTTTQYGTKQIVWDDNSTTKQTADIIAEYFGLSHA